MPLAAVIEESIAFLNVADVRSPAVMVVGEVPHHFTLSVVSFVASLKTKISSGLRNPCFPFVLSFPFISFLFVPPETPHFSLHPVSMVSVKKKKR